MCVYIYVYMYIFGLSVQFVDWAATVLSRLVLVADDEKFLRSTMRLTRFVLCVCVYVNVYVCVYIYIYICIYVYIWFECSVCGLGCNCFESFGARCG